jgi:hypothetical protein
MSGHDLDPPDEFCHGDDPCVCLQIRDARADERRKMGAQ